MTLDGFLSFIALMIAVYALAPRHKQLDFLYRLYWSDYVIGLLLLLSVVYLQYYSFFQYINLTKSFNMTNKGLGPEKVSFLIALFFGSYLMILFLTRGVGRKNIEKFKHLCEELANQKLYAELASIIEKRLGDIRRIHSKQSIYEIFYNYLNRCSKKELTSYESKSLLHMLAKGEIVRSKEKISLVSKIQKKAFCYLKSFHSILPEPAVMHKRVAQELIDEIILSEEIVKGLIQVRPYFSVSFLEHGFNENKKFIDIVLQDFQSNIKSILYQEIQRSRMHLRGCRYQVSKTSRLISLILVDTKFAVVNQVWKPIGEHVIKKLNDLNKTEEDTYNWPCEYFDQEECQILNGIHYFDIMVREALVNDVSWHMWLYYFTHFTDGIIKNMGSGAREISKNAEFPTRYHYLIYTIFSVLDSWVDSVDEIPPENENLKLLKVDAEHQNDNIIKSAIITLGICLKKVLESHKIEQNFKSYIASGCFDLYFRLLKKEKEMYAQSLSVSIAQGGYSSFTKSPEYEINLQTAFIDFDKIPYTKDSLQELEKILFSKK